MIGIDIVEVSDITKAISRGTFYQKAYSQGEKEYYQKKDNIQSLAGFFCAKEAFFKALGCGIKFPLADVEVSHHPSGQPYLIVKGHLLELVKGKKIELSISHTKNYATAVVMILD